MKRLDELSLTLLDGELSDAEFDELCARVEGSPTSINEFCVLLQLEAVLHGEREFDLVQQTMQRIEERQQERAKHRVMDTVWAIDEARKVAFDPSRHGRTKLWFRGALAVAASLLIVVGVYQFRWFGLTENARDNDLPLVASCEGRCQLTTSDGSNPEANVGQRIQIGQTLLLNDDDEVLLRYADGTEIELTSRGKISIGQTPMGGKQLHLIEGQLHADVAKQPAGQPLVIATPHADVRVLGTRFDLSTGKNIETRLELESGKVELIRGDEKPVTVQPEQVAIIHNDVEPIELRPLDAVIETPKRQLEFRGIRSIDFDPEHAAIVGTTDSHTVRWLDDGSVSAVPFAKDQQGKPRLKARAGLFVLLEERPFDRLVVKDIRLEEVAHSFEDTHQLPRHFNETRDRNDPFAYPGRKWALSPQGDWAIGKYHLGGFMVWHCDTNQWRELENKHRSRFIEISPDGQRLALVDWKNRAIEFFDVRKHERLGTWPLDSNNPPTALGFSADESESDRKVFLAFPGELKIFASKSGELIDVISEPGIKIDQLAAAPNGRYLAAVCSDHKVRVWDIQTLDKLPTYRIGKRIVDLKFSPDSHELALVYKSGHVSIWDVPGDRVSRK